MEDSVPSGTIWLFHQKGTLFYNGKVPNDSFLGRSPFKGGVALEADWNGRILWEVREPNHHHDGRLLRNGNLLLLCSAELPDSVARKIQGGRRGTEVDGKIWADYLVEYTTEGARSGSGELGRISIQMNTASPRHRTLAPNEHTEMRSSNLPMETC